MNPLAAVRSNFSAGKILVVWEFPPTPSRDAGSLRLYCLLRLLEEFAEQVVFLPRLRRSQHPPQSFESEISFLIDSGIKVPGDSNPLPVTDFLANHGRELAMVILSGAYAAAEYYSTVRRFAPQATLVYDTVDLHHLRLFREAKLSGRGDQLALAVKIKKSELALAKMADQTLVVTEREKELLLRECPGAKVSVLSTIHQSRIPNSPWSGRRDLIFLGNFSHSPNVDAARYLIREILPLKERSLPEGRIFIIGGSPPPEISRFQSSHIVVTGHVDELFPYFENCFASLAPLRFGAGVKGKILTSMEMGVPVIGTSMAAEGMSLREGRNFLFADRPEEFLSQMQALRVNEALWRRISQGGLELIEKTYSPSAARATLGQLFQRVVEKKADHV
jgi:hypothetical protein